MRCAIDAHVHELEARLNDFDGSARMEALRQLRDMARAGRVYVPPEEPVVNLHCHTFFSFNAYGHSPASLAWLARKNGYLAIGIVDFDVLDAVDEFLRACEMVGVRGTAGIETRVYIPEFATREINSPGEPGVYYHMGVGFTTGRVPAQVEPIFQSMRERATRRNRAMLSRVNAHLSPLEIDYEAQVLPLAPSGNATERHMLQAYISEAARRFPAGKERNTFWAGKLGVTAGDVGDVIGDYAKFSNLVRSRLMKRGGAGYVLPTPDSFSGVEEFHRFIVTCGALPCAAWLDGTSAGEQAIGELLEMLVEKGVVALNIIPDRNWNLPPGETRDLKIAKLHEIVQIAEQFDLPLNVGTEMNSPGNRLVDDFSAAPLAPLRDAFIAGAYFVYGHTVLQAAHGLGYQSEWGRAHLPGRRERNRFYESAGRRIPPGRAGAALLDGISAAMTPSEVLSRLAVV